MRRSDYGTGKGEEQTGEGIDHERRKARPRPCQVHGTIFSLGKNALFLGANAAYWQVRYADIDLPPGQASRGRQLICYKSGNDPIQQRVSAKEGMLKLSISCPAFGAKVFSTGSIRWARGLGKPDKFKKFNAHLLMYLLR
jgi:hypothetical protein